LNLLQLLKAHPGSLDEKLGLQSSSKILVRWQYLGVSLRCELQQRPSATGPPWLLTGCVLARHLSANHSEKSTQTSPGATAPLGGRTM